MMSRRRRAIGAILSLSLLLGGCGGSDGGSGNTGGVTVGGGTTPTPTGSGNGTCSLRARQDWAYAQLREWYLFTETLPASLDPAGYATLPDYVDALTATARAQGRDRYFTYVTSIAEENAYYQSGQTAGYGMRLKYNGAAGRVLIAEVFEGTAALAAGLDRGTEILGICTSQGNIRAVSDIMASSGASGVIAALGPDNAGTMRVLRVQAPGGAPMS